MNSPINILLLEDSEVDIKLLNYSLKKSGLPFNLHVADTEHDFIYSLENKNPDIVLSDHSLPSFNSIKALRIVKSCGIDIPFILVTGTVSEEFAVQCMKEGADDYILKSSLTRLSAAIENCLAKKQIKREKELVESLHARLKLAYDEIEEMNKDLTDSIEYAKLIQDAVLPDKKLVKNCFPESFILYKPKDIVSGDFYWLNEINGKIIFAVADCTGHGVPGALMSMIGSNLLNEIVNRRGITQPSIVLAELNSGIHKMFRQNSEGIRSQDGMDIGICCIDKRRREMEFSGAHLHLYYFRQHTFTFVKGDQIGIGGFQPEADRKFINHLVNYDKGDTIYLFSDGCTDQFGGVEGRRFQRRNFLHLLEDILSLPMNDQEKMLERTISNWQGDLKQTDDIVVAGIKL